VKSINILYLIIQ